MEIIGTATYFPYGGRPHKVSVLAHKGKLVKIAFTGGELPTAEYLLGRKQGLMTYYLERKESWANRDSGSAMLQYYDNLIQYLTEIGDDYMKLFEHFVRTTFVTPQRVANFESL